jgi:hypothetical protein
MTLQLISSECHYLLGKFHFLFYQYTYLSPESTKLIQPLTLGVHNVDSHPYPLRTNDGSLWGCNGDSLTYPLRAQWRLAIHSLTLWEHSIAFLWGYTEYPLTYTHKEGTIMNHSLTLSIMIHSLTLWWIIHLLSECKECRTHHTLWLHGLMHSPTPESLPYFLTAVARVKTHLPSECTRVILMVPVSSSKWT